LLIRGVSIIQGTIDRRIRRFGATGRNYSKIERNCAETRESSIRTRPSYEGIYGAVPVRRRLLGVEPKLDRASARFGRTVERFAKIMGSYDAIWISMAGIGIPTITEGTAMPEIVTAGRIAIAGVGIVTGGIATEKKVLRYARIRPTFNFLTISSLLSPGGGQRARLAFFPS
jgi:hypothetical protein